MKKTHFINNETLLDSDSLNNIFIEPPKDGRLYLRKNDAWVRTELTGLRLYGITFDAIHGLAEASPVQACAGDVINVTAAPDVGYVLNGLALVTGDDVTEITGNSFVMPESDVTVQASFEPIAYAVTVYGTANGEINADLYYAKAGDSVRLTVTPHDGCGIKNVTVSGEVNLTRISVDTDGTEAYVFTMPAREVEVSAEIEPLYFVYLNDTVNGTVTLHNSLACAGDTAEFTVTPSNGYKVYSVSVSQGATGLTSAYGLYGVRDYSFTMPAKNVTVTVAFTEAVFCASVNTISSEPQYGGAASISHVSNIPYGTRVRVDYVAAQGSGITGISANPPVDLTLLQDSGNASGSYEFDMPNSNIAVTVTFGNLLSE